MAAGDHAQAYEMVQLNRTSYSKRERLLYHLDLGLTAHYGGLYEKSNENLEKAEQLGEELYTKSFTAQSASFLINDYLLAYRGEDFERALIHLFKSLNYLKLGKVEDALVEARQVDSRLQTLNASHPDDQKNVYREDALIRFIMGLVYESEGKLEDAVIDYAKSEEVFQDYRRHYGTVWPQFLLENLLTAADGAGRRDLLEEYQQRYPRVVLLPYQHKKDLAEVVVVHYSGRSPVKVGVTFPVAVEENVVLQVAIPTYQKQPRSGEAARITLQNVAGGNPQVFETELMEDVEAIAITNLQNRLMRMTAKAIARVTAQYFLIKTTAEKVRQEYGEEAAQNYQLMMSGLAQMISQPDLRSCRSLPAEIRVGCALLVPGEYDVQAALPGRAAPLSLGQIKLEAGKKEFILLRSLE